MGLRVDLTTQLSDKTGTEVGADTMPKVSVVICTHNPRIQYITRVLDSLKVQTLPQARWELLLIDNASDSPLDEKIDLTWHVAGRCVREDELGINPARIRGIRESTGEFILFLDDDNVVPPNYLERGVQIGDTHPFLGAWGGSVSAEFEMEPPQWVEPYLPWLAIREIVEPIWSNDPKHWFSQPVGAGMYFRRAVGDEYVSGVNSAPHRKVLGRRGTNFAATGEDTDIALTASALGMGWGVFPQLRLTHLIPPERTTPSYIVRIGETLSFSWEFLMLAKGGTVPTQPRTSRRVVNFVKKFVRRGYLDAKIGWARERGSINAVKVWRSVSTAGAEGRGS